jgi:hypothetical protein
MSCRTMNTERKYEMNAVVPHDLPPPPTTGTDFATAVHNVIITNGIVVLKTQMIISVR